MADAPKSGGGISEWGTFEIVLVVLLAIGLLSRLGGGPVTPGNTTPTAVKAPDTSKANCGLVIARPHSLERVDSFVTLLGTVGSCNWLVYDNIALNAQVIDVKGLPISAYVAVPANSKNTDGTVSFNASIRLTTIPATKTGYLILIPSSHTDDTTVQSVRIPLTFTQ